MNELTNVELGLTAVLGVGGVFLFGWLVGQIIILMVLQFAAFAIAICTLIGGYFILYTVGWGVRRLMNNYDEREFKKRMLEDPNNML